MDDFVHWAYWPWQVFMLRTHSRKTFLIPHLSCSAKIVSVKIYANASKCSLGHHQA